MNNPPESMIKRLDPAKYPANETPEQVRARVARDQAEFGVADGEADVWTRASPARIPTKPGFYWAQWRILEDDSATETLPPIGTWEIVDVFENGPIDHAEHLRVHVAGESQGQAIENFFWGPGPLEPPR